MEQGLLMPQRRNRRRANDPEALASRLPDELRSFDGWLYPNGLQDYMAALSAFLVDSQPVTPVMNAAGLSAAGWFRQMLMKGPTRAARGTRSAAQGPRLGRRSMTKISYTAPGALAARYRLSDDLTDN